MPGQPPVTINFSEDNFARADTGENLNEDYSPSESWSLREVSCPKLYNVPWDNVGDAVAFFLGLSYMEVGSYRLRRLLPRQHPRWTTLYATRITDKRGVKFRLKNPGASSPNYRPMPLNQYDHEELHVDFSQVPYRVRSDFDVFGNVSTWQRTCADNPAVVPVAFGREWLRWCAILPEPYADFSEIEKQALAFAEGPSGVALNDPANPLGRSFPGGIGLSTSKMGLSVKWYHVPHEYLFQVSDDSPMDDGVPWNLLAGINKLNAGPFLGYPAGTLLADAPKLDKYTSPIQFVPPGRDAQFYYDVTFNFRWWDPPKGARGSPYRGWNLAQYWPDQKHYYVTRVPLTGIPAGPAGAATLVNNPPPYPYYLFESFFLPPYGAYLNWYTWRDQNCP